jgi:RNA polymerase-binding transcription factor DksA
MEPRDQHSDNKRESKPAWGERDLQHFEKRLLEERKRALAQMHQFEESFGVSQEAADGELTSWRFHMADEGTDTYEQEQNFLLASREGRLLWHIDEALRRLYKSPERFGRCDSCGKVIGFERLDAIPYVVRCVDCKQDWEGGRAD